jgi:mannose-1-phosphate guanylyltransferase
MKIVLLCGGSGQRLWPLSRERYPKQFIPMFKGQSLFDLTVERNQKSANGFMVVTNSEQFLLAKRSINNYPENIDFTYVIEPMAKNTAYAICYAALASNPEDVLLVLPTDHLIQGQDLYEHGLARANQLALEGNIVCFGIKPTRAETGYGYIQHHGEKVLQFKEKPSQELAKQYLEAGEYVWNSGMFCFQAKTLIEEMREYCPEVLERSQQALKSEAIDGVFYIDAKPIEDAKGISIDYALMEKTKKIKVVPLDLDWSDAGCFDELSGVLSDQNTEQTFEVKSNNNFVYSTEQRMTCLVGVDDLVVIDDEDALLICKQGQTQDVKKMVGKVQAARPEIVKYGTKDYRPWGYYSVLGSSEGCKIKSIVVYPGKRLSLQKHTGRSEHWIVKSGSAIVQVGEEIKEYQANDHIYIPCNIMHRLENNSEEEIEIIEVQMGPKIDEGDIIRLEDDYHR